MEHSFDINFAKEVGIIPAILYKNILFWVIKSRANEKHFYQGKYWAYNSFPAFQKQFPYLTEYQIRYAIKKLISDGWIESAHFSEDARDRTCWYTVTGKKSQHTDFPDAYVKIHRCICENSQMEEGNFTDVTRASTISPDIYTDIDIKKSNDFFSPEPENSQMGTEFSGSQGTKRTKKVRIFFDYDGDCRIHGITEEQLAIWREMFPSLDVEQELRSASAWLDGNRKQRKHDVKRFLVNWLTRGQDRTKGSYSNYRGEQVLTHNPVFAPNERGLKHD